MIHETTITFTQAELTSILILATEFLRRDEKGLNKGDIYQSEHTRQIWLRDCNSIVRKADRALTHCIVTDALVQGDLR